MQVLPINDYPQLLEAKVQRLSLLLAPFCPPKLRVFESPRSHYRMRAEFRIWHNQGEISHVMFDPQTKKPYKITQFPIAGEFINEMMNRILPPLQQQSVLSHKLFQIDYLSTLSGKMIISLLYHKPLDDSWQLAAKTLKEALQQTGNELHIIGRASKQKIVLDQDYIDEVLHVNGKPYHYRQVENSFTQPNAKVNEKMLQWVQECTQHSMGDLLELYCGNGNFSIALAQQFRRVLATEIAKPSVKAAQFNIQANNIDNLTVIRMSAEDFTRALKKERVFNRLKGIDLDSYQCNTILVDPPRSGLDPATLSMVQHYPYILYISCNPDTLVENLQQLCQTHHIEKVALFDQFPYTHHIETGIYLKQRNLD